jgi:UDP-N-acetylglucosamine 1-carboxyvinyltransferase
VFLCLIVFGVQEPEVVDLANFLVSCGACIHGAGTSTLRITGTRKLHGTEYQIIPDRIEAGTFLMAAAITRSAIAMSPVIPKHLTSVMNKLRIMGCRIQQTRSNSLRVCPDHHIFCYGFFYVFFLFGILLRPFGSPEFFWSIIF